MLLRWLLCLSGLLFVQGCSPSPQEPQFDLRATADHFEARAANPAARRLLAAPNSNPADTFQVFIQGATTPLFGTYATRADSIIFQPAAPPVPGMSYRLQAGSSSHQHHIPAQQATAPPRVIGWMPRVSIVPANHLKFYLQFDQPMTQGDVWSHLQLHCETDGQQVLGAFREVELWDPTGTILTLWLHPGRQKTGVNLNQDEGPVLHAGKRYTLRVLGTWTATSGTALGQPWHLPFTVGPADHQQPAPEKWKLNISAENQLTIQFDEPLDFSPATPNTTERLWLETPTGQRLPTPLQATTTGATAQLDPTTAKTAPVLKVSPDIEDLAGNSISRPFERQME